MIRLQHVRYKSLIFENRRFKLGQRIEYPIPLVCLPKGVENSALIRVFIQQEYVPKP